jgi:hypothetical protein
MKNYPLDIEECVHDEVTIFSRGHHDFDAFIRAAALYICHHSHIKFNKPAHEWWRVIPDGDGGGFIVDAKPNSRGAYPVTALNEAWSTE